jgi:hypothetical protein
MSKYEWTDANTRVIVAPLRVPQFAEYFLQDTGLKAAAITSDGDKLREEFGISSDPPFGVAIENGRTQGTFVTFDDSEPKGQLQSLGWVKP